MRVAASAFAISWIPPEAVQGWTKVPFEAGITHYDDPPPDLVEDLEELRKADRFRFANQLEGWIEVQDGKIVSYGQGGGGLLSVSKVKFGHTFSFQAVSLPNIRPAPSVSETSATFIQTAGGRTAIPAPRWVRHKPFIQIAAPLAWTTLALTINADGSTSQELIGASPFPRHWIYDRHGKLILKSGMIDFQSWYRRAFSKHSPWGDQDSPALVAKVETALERHLSSNIMNGAKPSIQKLKNGATLVEQGQPGKELYLLVDGLLAVEVDGEIITEIGPGAILGERALLEGGIRTSTLRAVTPCKVAVVSHDLIDLEDLRSVSQGHRLEEQKKSQV